MPFAQGQGSGDFRETSSRIHLFHMGVRDTSGVLAPGAFNQSNPPVVDTTGNVSTTLAGITKVGVLGGSIAFTRPDAGNGYHGGPIKIGGNYVATQRPLGLFLNDAVGNAYENTPGPASLRGAYVKGMATVGVTLWETQQQIGGTSTLSYSAGNKLYASVNGFLTNRIEDAYEYRVVMDPDNVTIVGILRVMPDTINTFMVVDLRI